MHATSLLSPRIVCVSLFAIAHIASPGAYQTTYSGLTINESVVTKLNATGNAFVYSKYLGSGQDGNDTVRSIAVDSIDNAYVTGPGCAFCTILNSAVNSVGQGAPSNSATATPAMAAQFSQQGPKLVGTGARVSYG